MPISRVPAKSLLVKSVIYRVLAIIGEGSFAYLFTLGGSLFWAILPFILIVNTVKIIGYFTYDLIWIGALRTRWNIMGRIKGFFSTAAEEAEEEERFPEEGPYGAD